MDAGWQLRRGDQGRDVRVPHRQSVRESLIFLWKTFRPVCASDEEQHFRTQYHLCRRHADSCRQVLAVPKGKEREMLVDPAVQGTTTLLSE